MTAGSRSPLNSAECPWFVTSPALPVQAGQPEKPCIGLLDVRQSNMILPCTMRHALAKADPRWPTGQGSEQTPLGCGETSASRYRRP